MPLLLPNGALIKEVKVYITPAGGHIDPPDTMPNVRVYYRDLTGSRTAVGALITDAPANVAAYELNHAIEAIGAVSTTGLDHVVDRTTRRYYVEIRAENDAGADGIVGGKITGVTVKWERPKSSKVGQD